MFIVNLKKDAASYVRKCPRLKHHQKDAIRDVIEITLDNYESGKETMLNDPYFNSHLIQEQRRNCLGIEDHFINEFKDEFFKNKQSNYLRNKSILKLIIKEYRRSYLYE